MSPAACLKCGSPFAAAEVEALLSVRERHPKALLLSFCGRCKAGHTHAEGGALRLLTAGELFRLELQIPEQMEAVRAGRFAPGETRYIQ